MSVRVVRPGLLTTVQDLGRRGRQRFGVAVGGAMDALSLRVANLLVGNEENTAALEMTLLGPTLEFANETLVALCGADFSATVDGEAIAMNRPVFLPAGCTLSFGSAKRGCRAYLAVGGGFDVPAVMGSRSTYLLAGIGGLMGRALQAGDELPLGTPSQLSQRISEHVAESPARWFVDLSPLDNGDPGIRALRGSEFDRLTSDSQARLFGGEFRVGAESDRMGYRLTETGLEMSGKSELVSSSVCPGTIQLPPGGEAILLMADCATTGGYAKVAHVASVDLPRAGQLKPGDCFRLREISLAEAHQLYREQERDVRRLRVGLQLRLGLTRHSTV